MRSSKRLMALVLFSLIGIQNAAHADPTGITCVQQELNALGYNAGRVDGILGGQTRTAVSAYVRYMQGQSAAGWSLPALTSSNAKHTCQLIADAFPEVSKYWLAIDVVDGLDVALVTFKSVPGNPFGNYEGTYGYIGDGKWREISTTATFSFVERNKTTSRITLWDGSRNLNVVIWVKMGGDIAFVYNGGPVTTFARVTALARGTPE